MRSHPSIGRRIGICLSVLCLFLGALPSLAPPAEFSIFHPPRSA